MSKLSIEWAARREGNDGFVLESAVGSGSSYKREFGPLPPHTVLAFIEARRRLVAIQMERLGADYVTPELIESLH